MRTLEITYMFWEKFFVITEDNQCHFISYPLSTTESLRNKEVANAY